jgi:Amt family ammonium transporter
VVGLVAITPAAGFVAVPQSIFIGVVAAIVSNIAVYYKQRAKVDDTLDVFPCHGIGGMVGMMMTGVFATTTVNDAGTMGLFYGGTAFFLTQMKAMAITVAFSFTASFLIFKFINFILPLRVSSEEEEIGLDATQHNEKYLQGTLLVSSTKNGSYLEEEIAITEKGTV